MELAGIAQEHDFVGYQAQAALLTAFLSTFRVVNPPFPLLSKQRGRPTKLHWFPWERRESAGSALNFVLEPHG